MQSWKPWQFILAMTIIAIFVVALSNRGLLPYANRGRTFRNLLPMNKAAA